MMPRSNLELFGQSKFVGEIRISRLGAIFPDDPIPRRFNEIKDAAERQAFAEQHTEKELTGRRTEWKRLWQTLREIDGTINWLMGDWLNHGKNVYGEKYAFALDATQWEYERLRNAAWVCAQVPLSFRNDNLDWTHHVAVAPLVEAEQKKFLEEAHKKDWTVSELRMAIRQSQATRTRSSAKAIGFVPSCWIAEGLRWFRQQDFESWSKERRETLRLQLRPLEAALAASYPSFL